MTDEDPKGTNLVVYREREIIAELRASRLRKNLSFGMGFSLVFLGVVDGAWNPLAFITAPTLIASGLALMGASTGKPKAQNGE